MKKKKGTGIVPMFVLVLALALALMVALTSPVSAVPIGNHDITFVSHTYDGTYSTWTYNVTSGYKPALSHWVITWCNESALIGCSENCTYVTNEPHTGLTGIKFDDEYNDNESRIVWFNYYWAIGLKVIWFMFVQKLVLMGK